ncbi:protein SHORTAGE IN CHIASMATA 1 [Morus notabilis]|uniref:protein SHORTAGE IN CHIASMATA 1 n=1 Tax=Morus notabilis TaxID=981085 RepID=UPI000CED2FC6|nr:protein SHORTAGE IN CHIASMATA 1 [Morus notabilis]
MRSRFSDSDFIVTALSQSLETLAFLQLPVPQVSPSPPISTFSDLLFLCFGSTFNVSLRIDKLPVETALSKFFSDVLPQNVDIGAEDFEGDVSCASREISGSRGYEDELSEETKVLNGEKDVESQKPSVSKAIGVEVPKKSNGSAVDDKITPRYELTQFETPELDVFAENASFFENEGIQILSKAPEIEEYLDMLKPGLSTHYPREFQSIISVEKITFEYPTGKKDNVQDDCSFQDQIHFNQITFPVVEADEIVLEQIEGFAMEEKLLSLFENCELQLSQKDNLDIGDKELLGSKGDDISRLLSDHYLSFHSFGSELGSLDNFPEVDLIRLVEISHIKIISGVQGTSGFDGFLSDKPVVYEEFDILDVDSSQIFEALLNGQTASEPETCDWMFNEDTKFKDFNKLIVSHELTLVDETFKSLPVPVICDHEKVRSFYTIIEGKLANLRPHPLSALDGIYLDWHLLEDDTYRSKTYFYENVLKDMGSHSIDDDWDSFGDKNVVYDFIFSDDSLYGFSTDENAESMEFLSDVFIPSSITEAVAKKTSERASLLFKSMSQSNDLDFFLNAQKATRTNSEPAIRAVQNNATSPKNPQGNSVAAISQGGESITISDMDENANKHKKLFNYLSMEEEYDMRAKEATDKAEAYSMPLPIPSMPFVKESNDSIKEYDTRAKEATDKVESYSVPLPVPSMPFVKESNDSMESFPETVIVVNTQTLDKEMIVSRRSTYQRILAMEKEGAQVVERDSDLPVDIIVNSAICLAWYDCRNIGKKASDSDEASSCLPLCIENIATNVLTLLSFNFSGCIMVFEGENSFLSTVMEHSDGFYAAAASLGIDVQLFCSSSSELTDEIIMSCIGCATRGVYPRMPESETLAESFLTKFPSVNPLTAHAILSSGDMLIEFLERSNEYRIRAIQKYHVPNESIALLGALCKYGELEESRSMMTNCSSSVSSGTDSKNFDLNVASKRKRWEYGGMLHKNDTHMDELLHIDPVNQFSKDSLDPSSVAKPYNPFMSKDPETFHELRKPRLCRSNLFHQEQGLDVSAMMDPSIVPKPRDFQKSEEPQMFKKIRKPELSFNEKLSGQLQGTGVAMLKNFDLHNINSSDFLFEDEKGEVIDLTGSPGSGKEFFSIADPITYVMPEIEKDATRKSKTIRRLSFGKNHQTTFSTSAEIFSGKNIWNSVEDKRHNLQAGVKSYSDTDLGNDLSFLRHPDKLVKNCFKETPAENSHRVQFQEKESSYYEFGGTPLSNALSFSSPGQKSPWTRDFLDRIREKSKSRLRNQSLHCDSSEPCYGGLRSISKVTKRRSPSILEFFKYQGGSTARRIPQQKKQKLSMQSSSSSKGIKNSASASILRTWTPIDKRSRQTLSFAMNNGESQTKLVWNEGTPNLRKKF